MIAIGSCGRVTYVKDGAQLLLGELDTAGDGVTDGSEDLLDLVTGLDVVDCTSAQLKNYVRQYSLRTSWRREGRVEYLVSSIP
jgi:hypothetical protein